MEADSAGSARAELAESASSGFQSLTQKSPTVISRMDPYLPASEIGLSIGYVMYRITTYYIEKDS